MSMQVARHKFYLGVLLVVSFAGVACVRAEDPQLEQSRSVVQSFATRLKAELKEGLEEGGPVRAVSVCKDVAPQIASEISRQSGANVSRTSLRYRNPANAPEPWQARVLNDFDKQADNPEATAPLEYFARESDGTLRYMTAIRTDRVCLACHGASVPSSLKDQIDSQYPHDRAVGYALGDVRGAFSVTWPPPDKYPGS